VTAADDRNAVLARLPRSQISMVLQFVVQIDLAGRLARGETIEQIATADNLKLPALLSVTQALAQVAGLFDQSGRELAKLGAELLDPASPHSVAAMIEHEFRQQALWHDMDSVLRASAAHPGQQDVEMALSEERLTVLLRAMRSMNPELISAVADLPVWDGRTRVLDVAGGHGGFLAAILTRQPASTGAVLDQPTARSEFDHTMRSAGLSERVTFKVCDLSTPDPLAGWQADAVLLCRCLHNFSAATIKEILKSAACTVRRVGGGTCVVVERHLARDGARLVPEESALFSAYMAVNCIGGHVPRTEWLVSALQELGPTRVLRLGPLHSAFTCEISA
jgi:hypothetical protein